MTHLDRAQQSSRKRVISVGFLPAPILQGEFCHILTVENGSIYGAFADF